MFFISECHNGWDLSKLSDRSNYYKMTSANCFIADSLENHVCNQLKNKKIALLIHEYNNSQDEIIDSYQKIQIHIQNKIFKFGYDHVIGFIWPGFENRANYFCALGHIEKVKKRLKTHLIFLKKICDVIDIYAHGMGARLACETLISPEISLRDPKFIRHFHCLGPAVVENAFENDSRFSVIAEKCQKVFVYHSENDYDLRAGFFILEWKTALGCVKHIKNINKTASSMFFVNCTSIISHHNGYKDSELFFKVVKEISSQTKLTCRQWEVDKDNELIPIQNIDLDERSEENSPEDDENPLYPVIGTAIYPMIGTAILAAGIVFMTLSNNN